MSGAQRAARRRLTRSARPADDLAITIGGTPRRPMVMVGIRGEGHVGLTVEDLRELHAGLGSILARLDPSAGGHDGSDPSSSSPRRQP